MASPIRDIVASFAPTAIKKEEKTIESVLNILTNVELQPFVLDPARVEHIRLSAHLTILSDHFFPLLSGHTVEESIELYLTVLFTSLYDRNCTETDVQKAMGMFRIFLKKKQWKTFTKKETVALFLMFAALLDAPIEKSPHANIKLICVLDFIAIAKLTNTLKQPLDTILPKSALSNIEELLEPIVAIQRTLLFMTIDTFYTVNSSLEESIEFFNIPTATRKKNKQEFKATNTLYKKLLALKQYADCNHHLFKKILQAVNCKQGDINYLQLLFKECGAFQINLAKATADVKKYIEEIQTYLFLIHSPSFTEIQFVSKSVINNVKAIYTQSIQSESDYILKFCNTILEHPLPKKNPIPGPKCKRFLIQTIRETFLEAKSRQVIPTKYRKAIKPIIQSIHESGIAKAILKDPFREADHLYPEMASQVVSSNTKKKGAYDNKILRLIVNRLTSEEVPKKIDSGIHFMHLFCQKWQEERPKLLEQHGWIVYYKMISNHITGNRLKSMRRQSRQYRGMLAQVDCLLSISELVAYFTEASALGLSFLHQSLGNQLELTLENRSQEAYTALLLELETQEESPVTPTPPEEIAEEKAEEKAEIEEVIKVLVQPPAIQKKQKQHPFFLQTQALQIFPYRRIHEPAQPHLRDHFAHLVHLLQIGQLSAECQAPQLRTYLHSLGYFDGHLMVEQYLSAKTKIDRSLLGHDLQTLQRQSGFQGKHTVRSLAKSSLHFRYPGVYRLSAKMAPLLWLDPGHTPQPDGLDHSMGVAFKILGIPAEVLTLPSHPQESRSSAMNKSLQRLELLIKLSTEFSASSDPIQKHIFLNLKRLACALHLYQAFGQKRYFSLHVRNSVMATALAIESYGSYCSIKKGLPMRSHDLLAYSQFFKLKPEEHTLLKWLNIQKGISYPNYRYRSTDATQSMVVAQFHSLHALTNDADDFELVGAPPFSAEQAHFEQKMQQAVQLLVRLIRI